MSSNPTADVIDLAALVRQLRKRRNVTLAELAERIGRSVGFISQVERGLSQPSVADLTAISETLGVPTTYFFSAAQPQQLDWVTRPAERRTLKYGRGISDVLVSPNMRAPFYMLETSMEPGASSGDEHLQDSSEQAGFILEGELTLWREGDEQAVTLGPNDSFQLSSQTRCRYANLGRSPTRVLWVFS